MITKDQFNEVWKDSSREEILYQFYFEHTDLLFEFNKNQKAIDFINYYLNGINLSAFDTVKLLEKIKKILEEE